MTSPYFDPWRQDHVASQLLLNPSLQKLATGLIIV